MTLTDKEEAELLMLLTLESASKLWSPHPENKPQQWAYSLDESGGVDEIFYGGSAGGGKTDLALGLSITKHKRSLILRRESTQLRGIIERSRDIIGDNGRFNEVLGIWRNLPNGQVIELGGCKELSDRRKYQGRPHDLIVFDEASEFLEQQVTFIAGWARTEDPNQHVLVLLVGNPPTSAEGQWIIKRYAPWLDEHHPNPAKPGEIRWFAMIDGIETEMVSGEVIEHKGERIKPKSRTFIPAKVDDNPYYRDTNYKATLQALPEPLRSQMLNGDFTAGTEDDPWQVIPTEWVRAAQRRWKAQATISRQDAIGADIARGGKDKTVIAKRYGHYIAELIKHPGNSTPNGPATAALIMTELRSPLCVNVDVIGVGAAVYDALAANDIPGLRGVNFAEKSTAVDKSGRLGFINLRAEAYWTLREVLDPASGLDVALPPDTELLGDLCAPKWSLTVRGVQVESKEDIHKRLGRSTDCGDAVALAFMNPLPQPFWGAASAGTERSV